MQLILTEKVISWFKEEWGFVEDDFIKIFVRYGGSSTIHSSFSLGISKEEPNEVGISTTEQGITFYIEQDDMWYIDGKNLKVDFMEDTEEVLFSVE